MKLHKISRLAPVSINDLPSIQGWLQSMAAQGFLLDCCDNGTFLFDRKGPVQRRYRIDPSKGNTMGVATPQLQDMYREFGWTYVDSYTHHHHVFYTDDPNAVEPFTTPEALVEKLERLKRKRILNHLITIVSLFLLHLWIAFLNHAWFSLWHVLLFIALVGVAFYDVVSLLKLTQTSGDEALLKPRSPEHTDRTLRFLRICASILLIWLFLTLIF